MVAVMEPPLPPGPSPSCWEPRPGMPSLPVALGTRSPLWASVPKYRVGRGAELESERQPTCALLGSQNVDPKPQTSSSSISWWYVLEMQTPGLSLDPVRVKVGSEAASLLGFNCPQEIQVHTNVWAPATRAFNSGTKC